MRTHTKSTLIALLTTITLALALAATTASARNISASEKEFEILFTPGEGPMTVETAGNNISCYVTLLGHFFERTIPKSGQVGVIRHVEPTNGASPPCTGGEITILNETLPWRVNYVSFRGTLPAMTSIRESIIGVALRIRAAFGNCLVGTTALKPAFSDSFVGFGGGVTGFKFDETVGIPLGGGFICEVAGEGHFKGTGDVLNLPKNASITLTLI